jgi:hypothetical protein
MNARDSSSGACDIRPMNTAPLKRFPLRRVLVDRCDLDQFVEQRKPA